LILGLSFCSSFIHSFFTVNLSAIHRYIKSFPILCLSSKSCIMLFSNPVRALPSALCCLVLLSLHAQAATIPIRDCRLGIRDSYYWENTSEASPPVQQPTPTESTVRIPWKPSSTATPTALGTGSNRGSGKVEVMIPFYMYPGEGAWAPMEQLYVTSSDRLT
jgi:hypothetical protein